MISAFVHGDPKPQPRARAFARNGKASVFNPSTAEGWKGAIAQALRDQVPEKPTERPVILQLGFCFRRPKTHYRKSGLRPGVPRYHTSAKDADNLAKAVMDCMTTLGIWKDDGQVARLIVSKLYDERPGCQIDMHELPETE